jgi:23S rRNA (pseudouridine1915-N3)-methyltransferase
MKISLLCIGKTSEEYLKQGIKKYEDRIKHYLPFELNIIPDVKNSKNLPLNELKIKEGQLLLKYIDNYSDCFLFDEKGKETSSQGLAELIENKSVKGTKCLSLIIGGAYGFSEEVYSLIPQKLSLSKLTFSHQMVRLIAIEQIYRALTIIKGEPYHHE